MTSAVGNFQVAVEALIVKDGKLLVTKRSPHREHGANQWETLTGRLNQGETFEEALHREVYEETKLKIKPIKIIGTFHFYRDPYKNEVVGVAYLCDYLSGEVDLNLEEQVEYRWATPTEALELVNYNSIKDQIRLYMDTITQATDAQTTLQHIKTLVKEFRAARGWTRDDPKDIAIGLSLEANEVLDIFQYRTSEEVLTHPHALEGISDELSDVLFQIGMMANRLKIDLITAFYQKLAKLNVKYPTADYGPDKTLEEKMKTYYQAKAKARGGHPLAEKQED